MQVLDRFMNGLESGANLFIGSNFPPFYFIPDPFMQKISNSSIDVTYDCKTQRYRDFAGKYVYTCKIQNDNYPPVAYGFNKGSTERFTRMMWGRKEFLDHNWFIINLDSQKEMLLTKVRLHFDLNKVVFDLR